MARDDRFVYMIYEDSATFSPAQLQTYPQSRMSECNEKSGQSVASSPTTLYEPGFQYRDVESGLDQRTRGSSFAHGRSMALLT